MAGLDKRLLLTAALFRTDIENEVSKMMTELTRNTVRNASKAMSIRGREYHSRVAGDWRLYPAKATIKNGKDVAQDGSSSLPYPRSTPSPYGANIRQPTISLLRGRTLYRQYA